MNIIKEVHLHIPHPNVVHMSHIFVVYTKFTRSSEKPSMVEGTTSCGRNPSMTANK